MNIQKWIDENADDLTGKTIAITGSTGGLTRFVVKVLASLNANFIFLNRNREKTQQQCEQLMSLYPNIKIEFIPCDLSNFESIKSATEILKQKHIDILYLAAGVYNVKRYKTNLGYDNIFQTNFISHYYIAKELLPQLNENGGNVVAVSSIAYNYSKVDENDIDFTSRKKSSKVYGNSKRYLTFALQELMKNQNATLSVVHPGVTLTEMTNHYPKAINWLVKIGIKLFFPKTEQACLSLVKGVFDSTDCHEWIGPSFLQVYGKPKKIKLKTCNETESKKIFEIAEEIYNDIKK